MSYTRRQFVSLKARHCTEFISFDFLLFSCYSTILRLIALILHFSTEASGKLYFHQY